MNEATEPRTITCNLFASRRSSSLSGDQQLSFQWLDGDSPDAPLLSILPPVLYQGDRVQFVLVANPEEVTDPNAGRDELEKIQVGEPARLELVAPCGDGEDGEWYSPLEPTHLGGRWVGDRFYFELSTAVEGGDPDFAFRITVQATPEGQPAPQTFSVDPEMYVGTGG